MSPYKQLIFVTGKGGVGKSALTAALASALSEEKARVIVIELEETRMSDFFGPPSNKVTFLNLNAKDCFEEYAARHIPKAALIFIKNRWVHHFIDATPGLKEILILGKITSLLEENAADFLIVDSPATGHTISLLQAPRIALKALRHGPLKATVEKILNALEGADPIHFVLVARLENFIVHETVELHEHLSRSFPASPFTLWIHGARELPDFSALFKNAPEIAKPLLQFLKEEEKKKKREENLLELLQNKTDHPIIQSPWIDSATQEKELRKILAQAIEENVCKRFLKKNG